MIDIHVHSIPMVDDGPGSFEESIELLRFAVDNGISQMIATPHYFYPSYTNNLVMSNYKKLLEHIKQAEISITLHLGNEIYLSEEGAADLMKGNVNTLAGSSYVLIELPEEQFYPFHDDLIFKIQLEGYKVIVAHIERYKLFKKNPGKLKELIQRGIFTQMNSSYIINKETRHKAFELISSKSVHIIASDGHNLVQRKPRLKEAYDVIVKKFDKETAEILFRVNPSLLLKNAPALLDV